MSKPNIVWILIDSLRPDQLAQFGNNVERTFLDDLIATGTSFTNCITAAPYTIGSENAIFTSFYPCTNRLNGWFQNTPYNLDKRIISFTDILKSEGYFNVSIYPARIRAYIPPFGFDSFLMLPDADSSNLESLTHYIKASNPKFCFIDFELIHNECVRNPAFGNVEYHKAVKRVSEAIQEFYKLLFSENNDTLVIISSDHGVRVNDDISAEYHEDERVTGKYLTDKTIQTLFTIIYPEKVPGGKTIDRMVRTIDIVPTILDFLDYPIPTAQGISLMPLINGDGNFPKLKALSVTGGMTTSPWKPDTWSLRTDEWKFVKTETRYGLFKRKRILTYQLYNLENDPHEQIDCIKDFPQIAEIFKTELESYIEDNSTVKDYYEKGNFPYKKYLKSRYYPTEIRLKVFLNILFRYKLNYRLKVQINVLASRIYMRCPIIREIINKAKSLLK
jgi:arylsulfatase A-like enzyme